MKTRITLITAIVLLNCISLAAQDQRDLEPTYGKQANVYTVSEHLWMSPSYDDAGQVCMMRLYARRVSETTNYLDTRLNLDEALKFINELFPVNTRGRRSDGFGLSDIGGGAILTRFDYEHVSFVFVSSFRLTKLPDKLGDSVDLDFPIDEAAIAAARRREEMKSDDQLMREHVFNAQVLEIYWKNRKCVAR